MHPQYARDTQQQQQQKKMSLNFSCMLQHHYAPPQYARDTQHEKIQRGLALGIALVREEKSLHDSIGILLNFWDFYYFPNFFLQLMYGQLEEADALIEDLCRDKVGVVILVYSPVPFPYSMPS